MMVFLPSSADPFRCRLCRGRLFSFTSTTRKEKNRERTEKSTVGTQLAWSFTPRIDNEHDSWNRTLCLVQSRPHQEIKNIMYGEANGIKAAVFDYVFVTGYGKHRSMHNQASRISTANLSIPYFSLRPEVHDEDFPAFGYQDIDFGQRPEFSKQYLLRGPDEQAIRRSFNDRLLSFFESYQGTCVDGGANQLFVFRAGYRFQPQEIQSQLALALNIFALLPRY